MEESTNTVRGKSLSSLSGMLNEIADNVESSACDEQQLKRADKIRCIADEILSRCLDSQESYLEQDYGRCQNNILV